MEYNTSIDIFKRYFERQLEKARIALEKSEHANHPFVTLSRTTGAGGVEFPERLAHKLNASESDSNSSWMVFDKDILEIVLERHNLPKEISKFMPEKKVSEFQDVIEQLFGLHPNEHKLIKNVSDTILHLSHLGNVVFVGRGSNIITSGISNGLHIRIIENMENRIEHIQKFFDINRVEAVKLIKKEDSNRETYVKKYFNKDINNPNLYSLVINLSAFKVEDATDLIVSEVQKLKKRITAVSGLK